MKNLIFTILLATSTLTGTTAFAHGGEVISHVDEQALHAEAAMVVSGKPEEVLAKIADIQLWPALFRDVVSAEKGRLPTTYRIDLATFGHAHDFFVERGEGKFELYLDDKDHPRDTIKIAYHVEAFDSAHTLVRLSLGFRPAGPAKLISRKVLAAKLKAKAVNDLTDLQAAIDGKPHDTIAVN